jgi:hypothetical protein
LNEKYGFAINFSKWISFIKHIKNFYKDYFIDTLDLEKIFYEVVRNKSPAEMSYEDFIDGLRGLSRKLVRLIASENESQNALLANDDLLFNKFLALMGKPFAEEQ